MSVREKLLEALSKPDPTEDYNLGDPDYFDPWQDVISNIHGSYAGFCDVYFIEALKAIRDRTTGDFMTKRGDTAELILYIIAGHGLTDYGTSPRYPWPEHEIEDLWDALIEKWANYSDLMWSRNDD